MRYEIKGGPFPILVCQLDSGEQMMTEKGSMVWMSSNMKMKTTGGGLGKLLSRSLTGENIFLSTYTAQGGPGMITFGSTFPGSILPLNLSPGQDIILQKTAFLAAETGLELTPFRCMNLLYANDKMILQRLSGQGAAFLEINGALMEYDLTPGEKLRVDNGCVAAAEASVDIAVYEIEGARNIAMGGEGLYLTTLTGPGHVWLQSMSLSALRPYFTAR